MFLLTLVFVFTIASNCSHAYGADTGTAPADFKAAIVWVAEKNIPAVVHIDVIERQEVVLPFQPFENDPFFRYFFDAPQMPRKYKREVQGLGTGMIMDAKGHILTNNHVVGGASKIQVLLANGRRYPASLVGADQKTDLAVIKISAKRIAPLCNLRRFRQDKSRRLGCCHRPSPRSRPDGHPGHYQRQASAGHYGAEQLSGLSPDRCRY